MEEEILHFTQISIEADVLAPIAERIRRPGSLLLGCWLCEELETFGFHLGNYIAGDAVINDLKETIVFAGFNDELGDLGPLVA